MVMESKINIGKQFLKDLGIDTNYAKRAQIVFDFEVAPEAMVERVFVLEDNRIQTIKSKYKLILTGESKYELVLMGATEKTEDI